MALYVYYRVPRPTPLKRWLPSAPRARLMSRD